MLVIGAAGLVGGNLLRLSPSYPYAIIPTFHICIPEEYRETGLQLDITRHEVTRCLADIRPDCVVNLSCMEVAQSEADPARAREVHAAGVRELARACRDHGIRLIHLSTDMVYSGEKGIPYTLEDEPDPISVYGRTKLEGETALREAGCNHVIVRSALVLGRDRFRKRGFWNGWLIKLRKGSRSRFMLTSSGPLLWLMIWWMSFSGWQIHPIPAPFLPAVMRVSTGWR